MTRTICYNDEKGPQQYAIAANSLEDFKRQLYAF